MKNPLDLSKHNYKILKELGRNREGGRISYLAEDIKQHKLVVIKKFYFLQSDSSWEGFKIYEREINFLKSLNHPNIPRYIESFETDQGFCFVQEYKDAPSLATFTDLPPETIKKIALSILNILIDLQQEKPPIIHGDIKPENILIDSEYNVYLVDFGLARIADKEVSISSVIAGTPGFMPPEKIYNQTLNEASDLYSLGATLICLLTNTPSREINSLIDDNYRFNIQEKLAKFNPLFQQWLTKMVEPNVKKRFPLAITAFNELQPISLEKIDNTNQPSFYVKNLWLNSLKILGILAILNIFYQRFYQQPSPNPSNISSSTSQTEIDLTLNSAQQWFQEIKPHCNSVEAITTIQRLPPPKSTEGFGYEATCYALAGKIEEAEQIIQSLPLSAQQLAVNIVFNIGHPVADAGDDQSAGPIMNLVVKYQPENYMALYHAGMSAYILGDYSLSEKYLTSFLNIYQQEDGWRNNAQIVLNRLQK